MPPTGPRTSSPARRGVSRGGIQKRRPGPTRVDKDGDLVMDAVSGTETRGTGKGRPEGSGRSRGRTAGQAVHNSGVSRGKLATQQARKAIIRGLDSEQANILDSRISHSATVDRGRSGGRRDAASILQLRVRGLKDSKASKNADGGLKDLLSFLERKATGLDNEAGMLVRIKKVC
jgi:nuclear RNA export factor